jgi:hypothetical protein
LTILKELMTAAPKNSAMNPLYMGQQQNNR